MGNSGGRNYDRNQTHSGQNIKLQATTVFTRTADILEKLDGVGTSGRLVPTEEATNVLFPHIEQITEQFRTRAPSFDGFSDDEIAQLVLDDEQEESVRFFKRLDSSDVQDLRENLYMVRRFAELNMLNGDFSSFEKLSTVISDEIIAAGDEPPSARVFWKLFLYTRAALKNTGPDVRLKRQVQSELASRLSDDREFLNLTAQILGCNVDGLTPAEMTRQVGTMISQWAKTSADSDPNSTQAQLAVAEEFALKKFSVKHISPLARRRAQEIYSGCESGVRRFYREMYRNTQVHLAELGYGPEDEIMLYRGAELPSKSIPEGGHGDVMLRMAPISSYSLSLGTATEFSDHILNEILESEDHDEGESDDISNIDWSKRATRPTIMSTRVKIKDIIAYPATGIGCYFEQEVVVLGGILKSTIADVSSIDITSGEGLEQIKNILGSVLSA